MRRGDIVLIKFPFTDLSSHVVRPAVVISSDAHVNANPDAIFIYISSVIDTPKLPDIVVEEGHPEFNRSGLRTASIIKCAKIVSLSKALATRRLGEIGPTILGMIKTKLTDVLGFG